MNNAALGIIYGFVAMVCYGLINVWYRVAAEKMENLRISFYRNVFITLIFLVLLPWLPIKLELKLFFSWKYTAIVLAISLIGFLSILTLLKAMNSGEKLGIISPIANSAVVPTTLISIFWFDESPGEAKLFSIALIFLGVILATMKWEDIKTGKFHLSTGVIFALITCLLWGVAYGVVRIPIGWVGPVLTSMIIEASICVYSAIAIKIKGGGFAWPDQRSLKYVVGISLAAITASLATVLGFEAYDNSIVSAIFFANPIVVIIYSHIVFAEKLNRLQLGAAAMIVAGITGVCVL